MSNKLIDFFVKAFNDIIRDADSTDNRVSLTKLCTITASAVFTHKILQMSNPTEEMMLIYMGTVGGLSTAHKFLSMKYGNNTPDQTNPDSPSKS